MQKLNGKARTEDFNILCCVLNFRTAGFVLNMFYRVL